METKSQSAFLSSVFISQRCGEGNLLMKRPFSVSVTGTNITDERTSKLMRNISKMVWNPFWRSILLKEFLGRIIAPLTQLQLQGTVMTTPTPRTTSIKDFTHESHDILNSFSLFLLVSKLNMQQSVRLENYPS